MSNEKIETEKLIANLKQFYSILKNAGVENSVLGETISQSIETIEQTDRDKK